jgi:hypothetical protein
VAEVALAIGRLGGHLNRAQDGLPGWQSLWQGMKKLDLQQFPASGKQSYYSSSCNLVGAIVFADFLVS